MIALCATKSSDARLASPIDVDRGKLKIYFYKLTVDDGGAPCVQREMLSLAI